MCGAPCTSPTCHRRRLACIAAPPPTCWERRAATSSCPSPAVRASVPSPQTPAASVLCSRLNMWLFPRSPGPLLGRPAGRPADLGHGSAAAGSSAAHDVAPAHRTGWREEAERGGGGGRGGGLQPDTLHSLPHQTLFCLNFRSSSRMNKSFERLQQVNTFFSH